VTLVNLRLQAVSPTAFASRALPTRAQGAPKPIRRRKIFIGQEYVDLPAHARAELCFGHEIDGPGVIEEASSSLVFPAGWRVSVDAEGNLRVEAHG